jgi:hypothetical protein
MRQSGCWRRIFLRDTNAWQLCLSGHAYSPRVIDRRLLLRAGFAQQRSAVKWADQIADIVVHGDIRSTTEYRNNRANSQGLSVSS